MANPKLMRPKDAAEYIGMSKASLDKMRCQGDGVPFVKRGSAVWYDRDDLDTWVKELPRFRSTSEAGAFGGNHDE